MTTKISVGEIYLGDVEDPVLYAASPLLEWEKSEKGQWVMMHAKESPVWHLINDPELFGYKVAITAQLDDDDLTYFYLKWN